MRFLYHSKYYDLPQESALQHKMCLDHSWSLPSIHYLREMQSNHPRGEYYNNLSSIKGTGNIHMILIWVHFKYHHWFCYQFCLSLKYLTIFFQIPPPRPSCPPQQPRFTSTCPDVTTTTSHCMIRETIHLFHSHH